MFKAAYSIEVPSYSVEVQDADILTAFCIVKKKGECKVNVFSVY